MRRFLALILFALVVIALYQAGFIGQQNYKNRTEYNDQFDTINREFWFVGEWRTNKPAYQKVLINNGVLQLKVQETDKGPYLLSDCIEIKQPSKVIIKRKAMVAYGNDNFMGGFALLQTDRNQFKPDVVEGGADMNFGNAVLLVEYVHNFDASTTRPGQDVFRVLMPDWRTDGNYKLIEPIFNKWFDETLIFNTSSGQVIYRINDKEFVLLGYPMQKKYLRIFTHSYGKGVGHSLKLDSFDLKVEPLR